MKVCFITPYSPKEVTGVGMYVSELSKALKKSGIDSITITKKVKGGLNPDIDIIEMDCPEYRFLGGLIFTIKSLIILIKSRKSVDIILLQRPFIVSQALIAIVCKLLGFHIVSTIHGGIPISKNKVRTMFTRLVKWTAFILSDEVIFVDRRARTLRKKKRGIIIENGVNIGHFNCNEKLRNKIRNHYRISRDDFLITFVGRISYDKGIYELLRAIYELKSMNVGGIKALFIGLIPKEENIRITKFIDDFKLFDSILLVGVKEDVLPYYCAADVFVLPSYDEGLPLALLEAMACGLPAVVSDVGGISFVIEDFKDGILVKPRNTKDLVSKLKWCINNPDSSKKIGKNANKKIKENHDLMEMAKKYKNLFIKITTRT
jgi:glycosyltransferase involved in cell wall biosynthesis